MSDRTTIGALPSDDTPASPTFPRLSTAITWLAWIASLAALGWHLTGGRTLRVDGWLAVDGLTVVMWSVATFVSGIVHSYARRYMAGDRRISAFFGRLLGFTVAVSVLVAADHVAVFAAAWVAMGWAMAELIGHVRDAEAQAARRRALRSFLLSGTLVGLALAALAWTAGTATISGILAQAASLPTSAWLLGVAGLVLAAVIQSALVPFHTWLVSSMTAPTPASALMHAGFVNAGGMLVARFAPLLVLDPLVLAAIALLGAASALLGKLFRSVQTDVKRRLGCSTVGQMGFMIMQAGLGFFGAAITHLILHGFYKAYRFLGSGGQIEHQAPTSDDTRLDGPLGWTIAGLVGLAGGAIFVGLTGKGAGLDSGLVLAALVSVTTLQAAREAVASVQVPAAVRYLVLPVAFLPLIAGYALAYNAVLAALAGVPAITNPVALTPVHAALGVAFLAAYVATETGLHHGSRRLYVWLLNRARPDPETVIASRGATDEG